MKDIIFLDFDGVMCDSISAICAVYNQIYFNTPGFIPANPELVNSWDMKEVCPLCPNIDAIFNMKEMFDNLHPFPNAKDVIRLLCSSYDVIVATKGHPHNLHYKSKYIHKTFPEIQQYILLGQQRVTIGKSIINMAHTGRQTYFLDDVVGNLESSNADVKLLFGREFEFNNLGGFDRLIDWDAVGCYFL